MAAAQEINHKPPPMLAPASGSIPTRWPLRTSGHTHSSFVGTINPGHRVSRRKSTNTASSVTNLQAIRAALLHELDAQKTHRDQHRFPQSTFTIRGANPIDHTGSSSDENTHFATKITSGPLPDPGSQLPKNAQSGIAAGLANPSQPVESQHDGENAKLRGRRASEGAHLAKNEGGKRAASGELRCDQCGKSYKHGSCLTKHLWEHDPAWSVTSKLLISKHQQVQLLEAATVLVTMNRDDPPPGMIQVQHQSTAATQLSKSAPGMSHDNDIDDEDDDEDDGIESKAISSTETTPPPIADPTNPFASSNKRHSGISSSYSRSIPSASLLSNSGSVQNEVSLYQTQRRLSAAGITAGMSSEEEVSLAAAVDTLCNFGTPKNGPLILPNDVPPVPPLPAQYAGQHRRTQSGNLLDQMPSEWNLTPSSYQPLSNVRDKSPNAATVSLATSPRDPQRGSDSTSSVEAADDEDGVFGKMEGITTS